MTGAGESIPHPLIGRQRHLLVFLRVAYVVAVVLAVVGTALPGRAGTAAGVSAVGAIVAVPAIRVAWLVGRWIRRGDPRFATVAAVLLAVMAVGALTAL